MKTAATVNPVNEALRAVSEAKWRLDRVVTSSESFDYVEAKRALAHLERSVRRLARIKFELEHAGNVAGETIRPADFGSSGI